MDYAGIVDEEDPLWLDGRTREALVDLGKRCGRFCEWLRSRPEQTISVSRTRRQSVAQRRA